MSKKKTGKAGKFYWLTPKGHIYANALDEAIEKIKSQEKEMEENKNE